MKKRIISSIALMAIALMLSLTNDTLATNQNIENQDVVVKNEIINTTKDENNTVWYGVNSTSTDFVNNINNQLQNANSVQTKDNRRATAITFIIIITVGLIAALVGWYYMTNQ